jgi:hypothetical protein
MLQPSAKKKMNAKPTENRHECRPSKTAGGQTGPRPWQPVPIHWQEEVRFEHLDIRQSTFRNRSSHWPPPRMEKSAQRLRLKLPGRFQQKANRFHGRKMMFQNSTRHQIQP